MFSFFALNLFLHYHLPCHDHLPHHIDLGAGTIRAETIEIEIHMDIEIEIQSTQGMTGIIPQLTEGEAGVEEEEEDEVEVDIARGMIVIEGGAIVGV